MIFMMYRNGYGYLLTEQKLRVNYCDDLHQFPDLLLVSK